ncbi:MAG TPA: response regulator transcription factor [Phenylobacterium sp.]|jgi:DNA-binding NarL/FixJ family response regulator|nr:response regulator transcription factor [Phenylobacterium sp.]
MKTLLVDDHAIVRDGLRRLLIDLGIGPIVEAGSGRAALALARTERPELVILDLNLPDLGGLEVLSRLLREDRALRVLVLTMHAEPLYATRALQAGAKGYVSKASSPAEITAAIQAVARGDGYVEAKVAQAIALGAQTAFDNLSARDLEILRLLAEGRSLGEIATALGVAYKTAANSCTQLKDKLGVSRTGELIRMAVEMCQPAGD